MVTYALRTSFSITLLTLVGLASCTQESNLATPTPQLRKSVDYATLSDTAIYANRFVDEKGAKTVDLTTGSNRLLMFRAINTYMGTAVGTGLNAHPKFAEAFSFAR